MATYPLIDTETSETLEYFPDGEAAEAGLREIRDEDPVRADKLAILAFDGCPWLIQAPL